MSSATQMPPNQDGKSTAIRSTVIREMAVSRHDVGPMKGPLKPLNTVPLRCSRGFGGSQLGTHYALLLRLLQWWLSSAMTHVWPKRRAWHKDTRGTMTRTAQWHACQQQADALPSYTCQHSSATRPANYTRYYTHLLNQNMNRNRNTNR